ncbi:MAG TPA: hypothetical protein ENK05_06680 [Gammaproteobacteria bacterium]|nr:hypothetical protein [Gammaproteobacteria bacterium]
MRHVLYLTSYSTTLYRVERHGAVAEGRFLNDEAGYQALRELLKQLEPEPIPILADLIEEEFRQQEIPHALGRDRQRLLERHARKLFRGTPFRLGRVTGRTTEGRRDDRALFSALTNPENVSPLIELMEEVQLPLAGIQSLPVLTRRLLKHLKTRGDKVLLVTAQPDESVRETFLDRGEVKFSRLAPVPHAASVAYCQLLQAEVHKTLRYLHTLRLLPRNEPLEVYTLTDGEHSELIGDFCHDEELVHFHPVDLNLIAAQTGFRNYPEGGNSDALFVWLLARRKVRNHYAPPRQLRRYRTWQAARALRAASWLLAVGGLSWSGINGVNGLMAADEAARLNNDITTINQGYVQLTRQLPIQPAEARAMREAIQLADRLERHNIHPGTVFARVGKAFAEQPDLEMEQFSWFASDDQEARRPVDTSSMDPAQPVSDPRYVIATIQGRLAHFDGSYRRAQRQVERLVEQLRGQRGITTVDIERAPLDTRPDTQIQGQLGDSQDREKAEFELRLVMEMDREPV